MNLTDKQFEVMDIFWESNIPMTITDIIDASGNRTWSTNSIYKIITQLEQKGLICVSHLSPTSTNNAKAYKCLVSYKEFMAKNMARINKARKPSIRLSAEVFIQAIRDLKQEEWEDE